MKFYLHNWESSYICTDIYIYIHISKPLHPVAWQCSIVKILLILISETFFLFLFFEFFHNVSSRNQTLHCVFILSCKRRKSICLPILFCFLKALLSSKQFYSCLLFCRKKRALFQRVLGDCIQQASKLV